MLIAALDVFDILWPQNLGFRWIEASVVTLLAVLTALLIIALNIELLYDVALSAS